MISDPDVVIWWLPSHLTQGRPDREARIGHRRADLNPAAVSIWINEVPKATRTRLVVDPKAIPAAASDQAPWEIPIDVGRSISIFPEDSENVGAR